MIFINTLFQQHKRRLYTWTSPHGQHRNQVDYIICSQRWRRSIKSAKTRLGADCGSDHELLIAKFRLTLKKVGKTTRPFRYALNQIPYDYPVEVGNRFKRLDLIECLVNCGWRFNIVQETGSKTIPNKKKWKKSKWLFEEALQIAMKRKEANRCFSGTLCFLHDSTNVGNLIPGSSAFSKPSLSLWEFSVHVLLKPSLKDFEHNLVRMWNECNCTVV